MIRNTNKCGCSALPNNSHSPCCHDTLSKSESLYKEETPCCCGKNRGDKAEEIDSPIKSEIVERGLPYKEIEAIINDNRMVVRMQTESPLPEYDPSCDCIPLPGIQTGNESKNDVTFQKANKPCRTMLLYPQPEQKPHDKSEERKNDKHTKSPTENPEENPNIFVLKIKKKRRYGEKKYNLNLEYLTPRPWRKTTCL